MSALSFDMLGGDKMRSLLGSLVVVGLLMVSSIGAQDSATDASKVNSVSLPNWLETGEFQWTSSEPLLQVKPGLFPDAAEHPWVAIKDPSIVRTQDRWHLFCSLRREKSGDGRIRIGYTSFSDWKQAGLARWNALELTPEYHGAPQVFFFEPQQTWYMIYQAADSSRGMAFGPCYSTNSNIADPQSWTLPKPLYTVPEGEKAGLDFWVICDQQHSYLFFTTLDGKMWQSRTRLEEFPEQGWSEPKIVLRGDIFEASHTYKLAGSDIYLTIIEAQDGKASRYYKAYVGDSLDGDWKPLAASREQPFASPANVVAPTPSWTESYSHGELLRRGINERMEVDPQQLRFLFQGAKPEEYQSGEYGSIPWKLGLLELVAE
jgi:hypothetical protein